jgi:hypothetical protein
MMRSIQFNHQSAVISELFSNHLCKQFGPQSLTSDLYQFNLDLDPLLLYLHFLSGIIYLCWPCLPRQGYCV